MIRALRIATLAALLALAPAIARASDPWTTADSWREGAYLTLHAIDWAQTRNTARNPDRWCEDNVILGNHPSAGRVDRYFALTALAHVGLAATLPASWRVPFQYVTIGVEVGAVAKNFSLGLGMRF